MTGTDYLVAGLAAWAVTATIALVHQHLRADRAVAALFEADERNERLTSRLLNRPIKGGIPYPLRRPTPPPRRQPTGNALPAPAPWPDPGDTRHVTVPRWATDPVPAYARQSAS